MFLREDKRNAERGKEWVSAERWLGQGQGGRSGEREKRGGRGTQREI